MTATPSRDTLTARQQTEVALLLSSMMVLVPALGLSGEELLQDTLKSMLVCFFALAASMVFFWHQRQQTSTVQLHSLLWLPLGLTAYALGSMTWSHAYLGGVEAVRWFMFTLILFLGMNTLSFARITPLAWCIHLGAVLASLWAALQFWFDWSFFAQGPNPASTFVNRNFFAEFVVCTLPFSVLLLTRVKDKTSVFLLTISLGFNIAALMMAGTRSAMLGLLILVGLLPVIIILYRRQLASTGWRQGHRVAIAALLVGTVLAIGGINTTNPKLIAEAGHGNALDRAFKRTVSMTDASEYTSGSFSIRAAMWKTTGRMILSNPMAGVGAGAWEVQAPRFQDTGNLLEMDYYAHNELLQLLAEYGIVGWLFLFGLLAYLLWAAHNTWSDHSDQGQCEAPLRACALATLLVLLLVSNAGFPWRLASTGALFAISLSVLAASDIRLGHGRSFMLRSSPWRQGRSKLALGAAALSSILALFIAHQAIECESKIVRAVKMSLSISRSGQANDPAWGKYKLDMLALLRDGIAINPHYRKLTPMVADALAGWGDWKNATWIWESILESRPNVIAILTNLTKSHLQNGNLPKAQETLARAKVLQPNAPTVKAMEVVLWSKAGKDHDAALLAKALLNAAASVDAATSIATVDHELVRFSYFLATQVRDPELAVLATKIQIKNWPKESVDGWLKLGAIYDAPETRDEEKALQAYRAAVAAAPPSMRQAVLARISRIYHTKLD